MIEDGVKDAHNKDYDPKDQELITPKDGYDDGDGVNKDGNGENGVIIIEGDYQAQPQIPLITNTSVLIQSIDTSSKTPSTLSDLILHSLISYYVIPSSSIKTFLIPHW